MTQMQPLQNVTKHMAAVAQGHEKAHTVIKNGTLVNVLTGELLAHMDVAITHGRIALVGDAAHTIGANTLVIDASGQFICPGFLDGHMHVESSMMTGGNYAKTVIPRGTTGIFADPHEIANVFGTKAIDYMIADVAQTPLGFYVTMPSCVPSMATLEDSGASLSPQDIAHYMAQDNICGLGEMMNFSGVLGGDTQAHAALATTLAHNKTITGHYPVPETGADLNAYVACGVRCCHESVRKEDALAKMRLGMYAQIREGSAWRDIHEAIKAITETNIDTRFACLVSDDIHCDTLLEDGHMDHLVRRAIAEGVNPVVAIQMVTINTAQCFHMDQDIGAVAPGKLANIVLLNDLASVAVDKVFIHGELVAQNHQLVIDIPLAPSPSWVQQSMNLKATLTASDFAIAAPKNYRQTVETKVIQVANQHIATSERHLHLPVSKGCVCPHIEQDVAKVVVVERHKATGTMGKGFVSGFGLLGGAMASTVAHDAHNLLIVGTNDTDMALAGNFLADCGGGMVVVQDGVVLAHMALPIAGLMCELDAPAIAEAVTAVEQSAKSLGCPLTAPFMNMAFLSLPVVPALRLTNKGLVNAVDFTLTSLFVEKLA